MPGLILSSFVLGIAFCAPPGVVTAESVRRGLRGGFWAALNLQLGSLIGDAVWALVALGGAAFLVQNAAARLALGAGGALVLLALAWSAFRDARGGAATSGAARSSAMPQTAGGRGRGDFITGALLSLGNPFAIAFWLGVGGSAVSSRVADPQAVDYVVFFLSFMLGALAWAFFLAGLIARSQRAITPRFFRWVNIVCGLALMYFAINLV